MVHVIYARRHQLGSLALRTAMWSPWSHCGVIDGDTVVEALMGVGVVRTPLADVKARSSEWAIVAYPGDVAEAIAAAHKQVPSPYDTLGVVGIGLHRRWQDPSAWFCSELVAFALAAGGLHLFRAEQWRITPYHLWMLNYPIVESKLSHVIS